MQPRTKRQREILDYITQFIAERGYEPSYQQIANHIGVRSKGGIAKHIKALEEKGLISRTNVNGSFHLEINPQSSVADLVCEIEWLENPQNTDNSFDNEILFVPKFLIGNLTSNNVRAMAIKDNAMLDKQICKDDIAFIEINPYPRDGEIVAAMVKNQSPILRKMYRMGADIDLEPLNDDYEIISHSADEVFLIGVFRGLLRPYV